MKVATEAESTSIAFPSDREVVFTRVFDAPRDRVFRASTDPSLIPEWWGPKRLKTEVVKSDLRAGGAWRYVQREADGTEYGFHGVYREVAPPARIVSTFEFEGEPGHIVEDTTILEDLGGRTRLTTKSVFKNRKDRDEMMKADMESGVRESHDRLEELLAKLDDDLVIIRVFEAPRELVWKAWTEPDRIKRWWGPKVFTAPSIELDLRVGGRYLYCMRGPDGKDYWSTGVFKEIDAPRSYVATDSFADEKGNVVPSTYYGMDPGFPLEVRFTVKFDDLGGKTKMTLRHGIPPSSRDREMARQGWNESLDKLAAYLSSA